MPSYHSGQTKETTIHEIHHEIGQRWQAIPFNPKRINLLEGKRENIDPSLKIQSANAVIITAREMK